MPDDKKPAAGASSGRGSNDDVAGSLRFIDSIKKEMRFMANSKAKPGFRLNPAKLKPVAFPIGFHDDRKVCGTTRRRGARAAPAAQGRWKSLDEGG